MRHKDIVEESQSIAVVFGEIAGCQPRSRTPIGLGASRISDRMQRPKPFDLLWCYSAREGFS